ncbi:MAG: TerC/Alx family metal homeostasis membrane protein [Bacteroidetes bacterium]|nr:TerC/Alx family metal homeostasis membrane protein [Bacteroidota bacterium]
MLLSLQFSRPLFLVCFLLLMVAGMALDLGLLGRKENKARTLRSSGFRTIIWVSAGLLFSQAVYFLHHRLHGLETVADYTVYKNQFNSSFTLYSDLARLKTAFATEAAIQYITGYFVEYSLSVDNLFVIMLIFGSFRVKQADQQRILVWGVAGALLMRFLFVFLGGALIQSFHQILYFFGGLLVFSGLKLLFGKDKNEEMDASHHWVVRLMSKRFRVYRGNPEGKFFVREQGKRMITTLFLVLVVVEVTDLIFAVDSVPAIFGITQDPYIVFFSNMFAIMGLRSLFFLLGHSLEKLHTLQYGLSLILIFIGVKMLVPQWFDYMGFNHWHNLLVLGGILSLTVALALLFPKNKGIESNT